MKKARKPRGGSCGRKRGFTRKRCIRSAHGATTNTRCSTTATPFSRDHLSLDEIVLQPGETCGARLVSFSEMEEMIRRGEVALPVANRFRDFRDQLLSLYRQIRK